MRVNSTFTSLFTHRMVMKFCITLTMIVGFGATVALSRTHDAREPEAETSRGLNGRDRELLAKQTNLVIREIGHRLLLQAGDSTSRVLPVKETEDGTFRLEFENEFVFSHDSLMMMAYNLFPKTQFPSGYMVTVLDCIKSSIVYGFRVSNTSRDNMTCRGRSENEGCYVIEFAFPDLHKKAEQQVAAATEEFKSVKADVHKISSKSEELKAAINADKLIAEATLPNINLSKTNLTFQEVKPTEADDTIVNVVYSGMLISLGLTMLIVRFRKTSTPVLLQNTDNAIAEDSVHEFASLGKFQFDVKGKRLLLETEVITLTDKECQILELLHQRFGELIPRETLMQKVWLDEGVITGRSLDMFVSKLRKKLINDPNLKITNVHGKGYMLEGVASH